MLRNIRAGEVAPLTGSIRCTACGSLLPVTEGQTVPPCPRCSHTEFRKM